MKTIVLNKSHIIDNGKNNTLVYKFPNSVQFSNHYVALKQINMYYSWFNISSALVNNVFQYSWYDGANTERQITVTIPDGLYEINDINTYFQSVMVSNGHYLIDNTNNKNIYFAEIVVNSNRYSVQVNTYQFNYLNDAAVTNAGYAKPSNFNTAGSGAYPSATSNYFNPKITFPANFNKVVGFTPNPFSTSNNVNGSFTPSATNVYVSKSSTETLSYLSHDSSTLKSVSPDVQPNNNILVNVNNVDNKYSNPNGIIYSVVPNVAIGGLIKDQPPQLSFVKLISGTYTEIRVQFLGTDLNEIRIEDPNITVLLVIKERNDI